MADLVGFAWRPIDTAPKTKTMILLGNFYEGQLRTIDYGCWEFIENNDWDGQAVFGWLSLDGMEEPTHWAPAPSEEFVVRLNDNGEDDSDEAYEARTEASKTVFELINE